jgi:type I restriction-modification system DNA methylase subunit
MSKEKFNKKHTKQAIKNRGEVFTPEHLVEEMLSKLPRDYFTSAEKTTLDNSCGNGNFLVKILEWRMKNGISQLDSLKTIYGIELDQNNANECKERLSLGSKDAEIWKVLDRNIICANALDPNHKGWEKVGYMWEGPSISQQFFDFS